MKTHQITIAFTTRETASGWYLGVSEMGRAEKTSYGPIPDKETVHRLVDELKAIWRRTVEREIARRAGGTR